MEKDKLKIALISLGCAKNLVDSEIILGALLQHDMVLTADPNDADVLLINTCSFIQSAQEESISVILEAGKRQRDDDNGVHSEHPEQAIVVTGCLIRQFFSIDLHNGIIFSTFIVFLARDTPYCRYDNKRRNEDSFHINFINYYKSHTGRIWSPR